MPASRRLNRRGWVTIPPVFVAYGFFFLGLGLERLGKAILRVAEAALEALYRFSEDDDA